MDPQFNYLTTADFNWSPFCLPLFDPRLTTLAYQQILKYLKEGLSSFPEFRQEKDETVHVSDSSDEENDLKQKRPSKYKSESLEPYCESEEASQFIQNARKILEAARGPLGDTLRSRIFTELENSFCLQEKFVEIKHSVLLSILGHEDLTQLTVTLQTLRFLQPEHRIFATIASKCPNLKELSIDIEFLTRFHDCEEAYYWKPLEKLKSLESLTIIGAKLPSNLSIELKLKTLRFLRIREENFSSYELCATLLRLKFKNVADVLTSWWSSSRKGSTLTVEELLECAGNEACLQPLCRSLTSLTIGKARTDSFWQPASAAFLLLACPNLKELHTTDSFPHDKALELLSRRKIAPPKTFNLNQVYVVLKHKENVRALMEANPYCREVIIQGLSVENDWTTPNYKTEACEWLHGVMDAIGEKVSTLPVTFRGFGEIGMEDLRGLSAVRELRLEGYSMRIEYNKKANAASPDEEPIFKNLRKLTIAGCLNRRNFGQRALLLQCPNLEELYIQCIHFCTSGKKLVEYASQHWKHLKVLFIKTMEEVMWDSYDMIALFKACPNLQTLVLPHFVVGCFQKEFFGTLHAFAEKRGAQVRYAARDKCQPCCEKESTIRLL